MDEQYLVLRNGLADALAPVRPVDTDKKLARLRREFNEGKPKEKQVSASYLRESLDSMCQPGARYRSDRWFVFPTRGRKNGAHWKDLCELLKSSRQNRLIILPKAHAFFDPSTYKQATKDGAVLPIWQRKGEQGRTYHQCLMQRLNEEVDPEHPFVAWSHVVGGQRWVGNPISEWMGQLMERSGLLEVNLDYARAKASGESYVVTILGISEDKLHEVIVSNVTLIRAGKRPNYSEAENSFALSFGDHTCWKALDAQLKSKGRKSRKHQFDPDNIFKIFDYTSRERVVCQHRSAAARVGRTHYSAMELNMPRHAPDITPLQESMLINAIQNVVVERPLSSHNDEMSRFTPLPQAYLSRIWFAMNALGYR